MAIERSHSRHDSRRLYLRKFLPTTAWKIITYNIPLQGKYILSQDNQLDRVGSTTSFDYAEDQRNLKKFITLAIKTSPAMRENIAYLNRKIFGDAAKSALDNRDGGGDEAGDELEDLLDGLALDEEEEEEEDEAPPTIDMPSPPRDITEVAPLSRASSPLDHLSRSPSPDLPETAEVVASSSARRATKTADMSLAMPPTTKKVRTQRKTTEPIAVSKGMLPAAAPVRAARSQRQKVV